MSSAPSATPVPQSSAPAQPSAPTPASARGPAPGPFVSTFKPSPQPSAEDRAAIFKLADLRQITLENGRIIDIPVSVLQDPAPKPAEFVNLQHYFAAHRGEPVDLSACKTADEAIDILADEIEAIRLVLYGYAVNFKRYVDRFEEVHDEARREVLSVAKSYDGLAKLVLPAQESAYALEAKFLQLQKKIAALPSYSARPLPKFPKAHRGMMSNPPMSAEEKQTAQRRQRERFDERIAVGEITDSAKQLADAAILKDVMQPPRPPPKTAAAPSRAGQPFTHALKLKINKVVEGVEAAREQLHVAQTMTRQSLAVLRFDEDNAQTTTRELWTWYDFADRSAPVAGKVSQANERRLKAWDKWADKSAEDAAAAFSSTSPDATGAQKGTSAPETQDSPRPPPTATTAAAATTTTTTTTADSPASPLPGPSQKGDVYAVTLDVSLAKETKDLTLEEALEVIQSLPIRVHFVPYGTPLDEKSGTREDDENAVVNGDAKPAEPVQEPACPSPGEKAAATVAAVPESPTSSDRDRCATKPRSRKRARKEDDDDAEVDGGTVDETADPRPQAGGSPVKKKRGGDA